MSEYSDPFGVIFSDAISGAPAPIQQVRIRNIDKIKKDKMSGKKNKLEDKSDSEIQKMIDALIIEAKKKMTEKEFNKSLQKISLLEEELVKRKSKEKLDNEISNVEGSALTPAVKKEASDMGANMALGALVFGVGGYLVGGFMNKNMWVFGIVGAVVGGSLAFGLSKYKENSDKVKDAAPDLKMAK